MKTYILLAVIWTGIMATFMVLGCSELWYWSELSPHLKRHVVLYLIFIPTAWLVGLGKLLLITHRRSG